MKKEKALSPPPATPPLLSDTPVQPRHNGVFVHTRVAPTKCGDGELQPQRFIVRYAMFSLDATHFFLINGGDLAAALGVALKPWLRRACALMGADYFRHIHYISWPTESHGESTQQQHRRCEAAGLAVDVSLLQVLIDILAEHTCAASPNQ